MARRKEFVSGPINDESRVLLRHEQPDQRRRVWRRLPLSPRCEAARMAPYSGARRRRRRPAVVWFPLNLRERDVSNDFAARRRRRGSTSRASRELGPAGSAGPGGGDIASVAPTTLRPRAFVGQGFTLAGSCCWPSLGGMRPPMQARWRPLPPSALTCRRFLSESGRGPQGHGADPSHARPLQDENRSKAAPRPPPTTTTRRSGPSSDRRRGF